MAFEGADSLPGLIKRKDTTDSFLEEKSSAIVESPFGNDEKIDIVSGSDSFIGDVYEEVRVIDLGSDGKERPIGLFWMLPAFD